MRKIKTKSDEIKKQKRNQLIIGIILVFVMLGSVFGVIVNSFGQDSGNQRVVYNGILFNEQNGFWIVEKDNFNLVFKNNPEQVENINAELKPIENYYGKPLYIYSENSEAELEIYRNLFYQNNIVQRMQPACLNKNNSLNLSLDCGSELPIKSCENNFLIIVEGESNRIIQKDSCVLIESPTENLTKATDEFLFNLFGIRQG